MQQLDLELSIDTEGVPEKKGIGVSGVLNDVWQKVSTITDEKKEKYDYSESIDINGKTYSFVISSKIKEWAYTFDAEKGRITDITFRLIGAVKEYRFKVGISKYSILWNESKRFVDDSLWRSITSLEKDYIQKINWQNWWRRFANWEWKAIRNFDYFQYLFDGKWIHHILMPVIKRVILDIENKRSPSQEK